MPSTSLRERLREARKRAALTQRDLAQAASVSVSLIRKLEQGDIVDVRMETARRIAVALRISTTELIRRSEDGTADPGDSESKSWEKVRRALTAPIFEGGDESPEPSSIDLWQVVTDEVAPAFFHNRLSDLAVLLAPALRDADSLGETQRDREIRARLLLYTGSTLVQARQFECAEIALERALECAPDHRLTAAAVNTKCWLLMRQGRLTEVREVASKWADDLEPSRLSRASAEDLAAWGWLLLELSAASVRDNRPGEAADALRVAQAAAVLTGQELTAGGDRLNTWGPVTVSHKRAENLMILDRPDQVLKMAARSNVGGKAPVTSANWCRHRLDIANAHGRLGDADDAVGVMLDIYHHAPEWLRHQQYAKDILDSVVRRRRALTPQMRELITVMKLPL